MWHDSVCNTVQEPTVTSTIVAKKTTTWGESGFPSEFLAVGGPVRADPDRHRASSFVITSNRAVDEWLSLFDDPILGNSALDRLANASYQIVIEGSSYRERLTPHRALLDPEWKGGD